jgi:hypothetical protein
MVLAETVVEGWGSSASADPCFTLSRRFVEKKVLTERLPRIFSRNQMRELVAMVNRAIDPVAAYQP